MLNPKCKVIRDNLLSEYPFTIKKEDEKKIYKEYIKLGYSIGIIKKGIELYHFFNKENSEYSNNFIINLELKNDSYIQGES